MSNQEFYISNNGDIEIPLVKFIQGRVNDLKNLIYKAPEISAFLKFSILPQHIEFLGACLDNYEFEDEKQSKIRFNAIINEYFGKINSAYKKYSSSTEQISLYFNFRCSFIHQLRPSNRIALTTRKEAKNDGNKHLIKDFDGYLILVLEDFFDDLEKVSIEVCAKIENTLPKLDKWTKSYLTLFNYN